MKNLDRNAVLAERLRRQRLVTPLSGHTGYEDAFRALQPVSPIFFSCPGDPPRLTNRTLFDDAPVADRLRRKRTIVKGRFLGGTIGYVLAEDLLLYAKTFCKPLPKPNDAQVTVLEAVCTSGPLTPRQLKDETGLLNKQIMPALHRLQRAFLVFQGAVLGHWRIGPHDVADITLTLPAKERNERREEILAVVSRQYQKPRSSILRYDGKRL